MSHSKLSDHTFKKGKFITPLNSIPQMKELSNEDSWAYGRMPEYIWIGLIFDKYGRAEGLKKIYTIISKMHKIIPDLFSIQISKIIALDDVTQMQLYECVTAVISTDTLSPLTIILTTSVAPIFSSYFYCKEETIEERCNRLTKVLEKTMDHQSYEATDIRFIALYFSLLSGRIHLLKEQIDLITAYPNLTHSDETMRIARPTIRACEAMILQFEEKSTDYLQHFWRCISKMTDCTLFAINFQEEKRNVDLYMEYLHEIFIFLTEVFTSITPLDNKMNVILGIATYSYKRLTEIYSHNLFNTISGRSCIRVLIENLIMLKYLLKNESLHENIWKDFQLYGLGLYKLVLTKHRENEVSSEAHFDQDYIEALVNEFKEEEFINMDTRYFDNQNIRLKAESVDEKLLYGLYYDYDSSFEHGLWGAIRESALLKCNNPAHQYHCVPDIDSNIVLKSVLPDCIMVMNKTITLLHELYGIPEHLINEVVNFELEPFRE